MNRRRCAADGYARATGDVSVALRDLQARVTNAVTGITTAYMDSVPLVVITGGADRRSQTRRVPV